MKLILVSHVIAGIICTIASACLLFQATRVGRPKICQVLFLEVRAGWLYCNLHSVPYLNAGKPKLMKILEGTFFSSWRYTSPQSSVVLVSNFRPRPEELRFSLSDHEEYCHLGRDVMTSFSPVEVFFLHVACLAHSSTLKVEAVYSSETWINFYQLTLCRP